MQDQNCSQQFEEVYQLSKSSDDMIFDQIIMELQEIMINPQFQKTLSQFMKNNWAIFNDSTKKQQQVQVFNQFCLQIKNYLQINLRKKIFDFDWKKFNSLFKTRKNIVEEQIVDTLLSLEDLEHFKQFIQDFRNSYEEEEMFKVLSVKSNKISENKNIKGKLNIFSQNENCNGMFDKGLKPVQKRKLAKQKNEEELLIPNLILTVKPMRKG